MNRTVDALIVPYARRRTLELVMSLSGYEADKDAYLEAKGILERAMIKFLCIRISDQGAAFKLNIQVDAQNQRAYDRKH